MTTAINATEAELRAITEVLKLAAILDDRAPSADRARIAAWAEQIHRYRLERVDLLDGLQAFYDGPSERAIAIGDLVHHARRAKTGRLDKEADDVREDRQQEFDIKAADEIHDLATTAVMGPVTNRTPRLIKAENALQCCTNKREAQAAIREYFAAKTEARQDQVTR
jgi:hypothetical protein